MSELHQSLMDKAYDRWQNKGWSKEEFHDSLDAKERFAVHTGNFNYQVENGGFVQWWDNRYGTPATVDFLLRACDRINTSTALQVKELVKQFKSIMRDKDPRKHMDEGEWEDIYASLEEAGLDKKYYEINEQFMKDCESHLKNGGY
jgi:hypothetical protein